MKMRGKRKGWQSLLFPSHRKRREKSRQRRKGPLLKTLLIRQGEKKSNEPRNGDFKVDSQNGKLANDLKDKGKVKVLQVPQEGPEEEESGKVEVVEALRQPRPARMRPPPNWKAASSNIQRQAVSNLGSKAVGTTQPAAKTTKSKGPSFIAQSISINTHESRPLFETHDRVLESQQRAKNLNDESQVALRQRLATFVIRAKERRIKVITSNEVLRSLLSSVITTYQSPELALLHIIDKYDFRVSSLQTVLQGVSLYLHHE